MLWNDLTFGVEIECYKPVRSGDLLRALAAAGLQTSVATRTHQTTPGWKVVPDGSLRDAPANMIGREVVSPILRGEDGLAQVVKASAAIKSTRCVINRSCGLHVHVGANTATVAQLRNLAKLFVKYEAHFDSVCPLSRRENRFAKSNLAQASITAITSATRAERIASACRRIDRAASIRGLADVMNGGFEQVQHYNEYRYFKLNFQSLNNHGTVEFRQQAGSVEAYKITNWIKCVTQFTAHAFTLRDVAAADEPTFDKFLRKVGRDVAAYLTDRRQRMNLNASPAPAPAPTPAPATTPDDIPF